MAILIVDDDPDTRARLERALRESGDGWDVRHAASAKEAMTLVTDGDVECVLLDYRLPDADGLTCLRELRRLRGDVPVVMVTGSGSEGVAVEAMKAGAADYVVKHATYAQAVPGIVREVLGPSPLASCHRSTRPRARSSRRTASSRGARRCSGCSASFPARQSRARRY
jgi:DNA-binding NtrC family response regulator